MAENIKIYRFVRDEDGTLNWEIDLRQGDETVVIEFKTENDADAVFDMIINSCTNLYRVKKL